ncbi:RidA family protein [Fimbriimonadia bacterium ATM]|nr:MAG: RidA family protein [Armatimonadota bacterium]MBC6969349.1 RidA family protein [Armatimonadota bacterium]MCE7899313.1 RidA family protein [Armatimonadetes bacterium ATM1]MDL1927886.1 RidA family protein [Fimbriimonadia bacterium ATM]RIJ97370.1 MAG: reactive intermediate/imine deaminase [Armatimonadota bacterium]
MVRQAISTSDAPAAIGPYSQAILAEGRFLFLSGQIPLTSDGVLVEGGIEAQAKQACDNLKAILAAAGLSPANLVKTTILLKDMKDFAAVNEIYGEFVGENPPARATYSVVGLPRDVLIEIEAIAVA